MIPTHTTFRLIACLALCAATAHGSLLYSQNVDSLTAGDLNGQDGYSAMSQAQIVSGGLSYSNGDVNIPGGSQHISMTGLPAANSWVFTRALAEQTDTVYFSLAMTWADQQNTDFLYFALSDGASEKSTALANSAGLVVTGGGFPVARIRGDTSGETSNSANGPGQGTNNSTADLFVGSLSKVSSTNYNTLRIWVNPGSLTEGAPSLSVTRDMKVSAVDTFYFFTGGNTAAGDVINIDSVQIGSTYASVLGAAIPEPGTFALIGLALAGLLRLRRRG